MSTPSPSADSAVAAPSAGAGSLPSPTGIKVVVPEATLNEFKALKTRRKYRYLVLKIDESTLELHVEKAAAPSSTGKDLLKDLPMAAARYVIFDFEYKTKDGRKADKLFFITWTPSVALGKAGMLYSSQRRALDTVITGVQDVQCSQAAAVAKLLELDKDDEEEDEWDPDA